MKQKNNERLANTGLIIMLLLQTAWFCNTYIIIRNATIENCNHLFRQAIDQITPRDTLLSLQTINSNFNHLIGNTNIPADIILNKLNSRKEIIETTCQGKQPRRRDILLPLPTRQASPSQSIQMIITNPYEVIFHQMILLLISTLIMMFFICYCIACQIRLIIRQHKISEMKEAFSHAMIHDMKTPIGSIQLGIHALRQINPDSTEKRDKYLRLMEDESNHLYSLANQVLTIAKLEQANLQLDKHLIPLDSIIKDLTDKFTSRSVKPVKFATHFATETVYADEGYLKEAVSNLIDNAIKYSGNSVDIDIRCDEKEDSTRIIVKDNGIGINMKDLDRIFEKFERTSDTVKRQRKGGAAGFGLGLNYVKKVVEAHSGTVSVRSQENGYSEFTISLPKLTKEYEND